MRFVQVYSGGGPLVTQWDAHDDINGNHEKMCGHVDKPIAGLLKDLKARDMLKQEVLRDHIAAISCGVYQNTAVLDLDYAEDSKAETDANFVLSGSGKIVEIQATAERDPFSEEQFMALLALARKGCEKLVSLQKMAVM